MAVMWGIVLILASLLAWVGQLIAWVAPATAVRLGLMEADDDVEPVFAADVRGEAAWDSITLWTLLVAGVLLVLDQQAWAYFGLVGGGAYLYFAGRGVVTRRVMRARGHRIGSDRSVKNAYATLAVWGVIAAVTIVAAVGDLSTR
jgi:hypothetical protein